MKIAIISDIHANLIALENLVKLLKKDTIDLLIHTGDAIGIGPFPSETLELLKTIDNCRMVLGNHENYQITYFPHNMGEGELKHQNWVKSQLNDTQINWIKTFPKIIIQEIDGIKISFIHSIYNESENNFTNIPYKNENELECYFKNIDTDVIFYGHTYVKSRIKKSKEYINPGAAGCSKSNVINYIIMEIENGTYRINNCIAEYNKELLLKEYENRKVPGKEEIIKIFY